MLGTGFRLLEEAREPGQIVDTPFLWSDDETWKAKVFTDEQPWLSEEAEEERREKTANNRASQENP